MSTDLIAEHLVALSRWVDAGNAHRDPEAITLHRVIKVAEEMGEAVTALIGALGANPRKGIDGTLENVLEELLDVAVSALGAYEHIDAHQGRAYDELGAKIIRVAQRAGAVGPVDEKWEYGSSDTAVDDGPIFWTCFGFPFTSAEHARHTADKNVWDRAIIWRRRHEDDTPERIEP